MKKIWTKTPALIKAIIFLLILGMPIRMINYGAAMYNLENSPGYGWALLIAIPMLFLFWKIVTRWSPFNKAEDVKINMDLDLKNLKVWSRILGLLLLFYSISILFSEVFNVQQDHQLALFEQFKGVGHATAIPLLLVFALTAGIVEEVVFRGYVQNSLVRAYPKAIVFMVIGLVFALVHQLPIPLVVSFTLTSAALSIVADEFKSLGVVIISHITVDTISLLIFYFGFEPERGSVNLIITTVVLISSLFLTFRGNNNLSLKSFSLSGYHARMQS
ncbi:MAG: CPBP family intramembrane metalloprotease [Ekhidna sp.]|nr:CPBP family intramembrane metalloprotease [Ekhidna sp.]